MAGDLNKEINRVANLKQNKDASDAVIEAQAKMNIWKRQIDITARFTSETDKKSATKIFTDYLNNYEFDSYSDMCTLADLVFEEILKHNLQDLLSKTSADESNSFISDKQIKSLHDVETRVLELQRRLNIIKDENKDNDLTALEQYEKRMNKYIEFHRNEFTFTCIAEDSLVLMSDFTTKNIQDVEIGDEIFGVDKKSEKQSTWTLKKQTVLNVHDKGIKEVFKIKAGIKTLELTPDHRILAGVGQKGNPYHSLQYFNAYDCYNRETKTFNYIKNLDDYYKGVLLGFIDSDGHIRNKKDKKHPEWKFTKTYYVTQKVEEKAVDWILKYLKFNYTKTWRSCGKGGFGDGAYEYYIHTEHTEFIDKIYEDILNNDDIKNGYLCGFLLGDGHRDNNNSWNITQSLKANKQKCDFLLQLLNDLNVSFTTNIQRDGEILNIRTGVLRIPLNCPGSKKISTWQKHLNKCKPFYGLDTHTIKIVQGDYKKHVYDLTTETKNFIVNGFVVHNCPDCGQPTLIRRRCDKENFEILKHPFFSGRFYYNARGIALVKAKIWTKEQYAYAFYTHPDYVDWCIKNEGKIPDVPNFSKEEIQEFVNKNPYLKKAIIPKNITEEK